MSEPEPADDIECIEWLREIDFEQYEETFLANFSVGGALLSRKRLAQVRLQDFPKMNILIYEHQKMLLAHIKHTLQYTFHSPIRKREVRNMLGQQDDGVNKELFPPSSSARRHISGKLLHSRRRSFDQNAWDSINKLRSYDTTHKVAAEHLRAIHAGAVEVVHSKKDKKVRRRRRSYDPDALKFEEGAAVCTKTRANSYGNNAHLFDIIRQELAELNVEILGHCKKLIRCEEAYLYFVNDQNRQMLTNHNGMWYKQDMECGIPGACVTSQELINVANCYGDSRFNKNMDRKIGIMSRTFMAAPVVAARGGGALIGVVCMQNKMGDRDAYFDKHDENLITQCAGSIAEELADRFSELLLVGEQLVNTALYVSSDTTEDHLKNFRHMRGQYVMPTASSEQYAKDTAEMLAALDLREHSANFNLGDSPEERKSLRMKHLRRDVYSKDIVA